jgi:hypothetical protein
MKKVISDFFFRGLIAGSFGPIVLAFVYLILKQNALIEYLTVDQVCIGIFSLTGLAFVSGGMNAIYQIEKLPLMVAILIHCVILYFSYLAFYLINGWLKFGGTPILIFSIIFLLGYFLIWAVIFIINKRRTAKLNEILQKSQHDLHS